MHVLQASGMHCLLSLRIHAVCEEDWESAGFGDFTLQQSLEAISVKRSGKKHVINLIGNVDPLYWWDYVLKSCYWTSERPSMVCYRPPSSVTDNGFILWSLEVSVLWDCQQIVLLSEEFLPFFVLWQSSM